jgi:hypothetical protein
LSREAAALGYRRCGLIAAASGDDMRQVLAIAALMFCGSLQAAAENGAPYRLIDLSDDFVAFYDRTEGMGASARVEAFKAEIVPLLPEFYGRTRFEDISEAQYDARIARALEQFPQLRERYLAKAAAFETLLAPAYASFAAAFPDLGEIGDVHLLHSLGEMDGGTRSLPSGAYFIFGADVMARAHPYDDEEPFFHHELFHIYHQRYFRDCGSVWCSLWTEGLATYAAKTLNPDASDEQLLLTVPEPIPADVDANLAEAVCLVAARINSRDRGDLRAMFSFARLNERLPPRFGYYVGYLVAREAGRRHSLQELARMTNMEAAPVVDAALAQLADCPAN